MRVSPGRGEAQDLECTGLCAVAVGLELVPEPLRRRVAHVDGLDDQLALADLEGDVEFVEIVVDGDAQRGPRLIDVIAASGVAEWETGEVLGMSEGRVVEVTLEIDAATVNESWVFDVTNRGTLKLAAPELPRQEWVRDVGEIRFP